MNKWFEPTVLPKGRVACYNYEELIIFVESGLSIQRLHDLNGADALSAFYTGRRSAVDHPGCRYSVVGCL